MVHAIISVVFSILSISVYNNMNNNNMKSNWQPNVKPSGLVGEKSTF